MLRPGAPAAASTGYLDPPPDRDPEEMHAPIVPPLFDDKDAQILADAAADMVASVEGLSLGPTKAGVSEIEEGRAPGGTPPRSESSSLEETDLEGSIDLESDSEASIDDDGYEDETVAGCSSDQVPSTPPREGEGVADGREEQKEDVRNVFYRVDCLFFLLETEQRSCSKIQRNHVFVTC